jgi:hypothetical protein
MAPSAARPGPQQLKDLIDLRTLGIELRAVRSKLRPLHVDLRPVGREQPALLFDRHCYFVHPHTMAALRGGDVGEHHIDFLDIMIQLPHLTSQVWRSHRVSLPGRPSGAVAVR